MSGYTPGPWVRFMDEGRTVAVMPAGRSGDVAVFTSVSEDNARLIAAAPDLLEALIRTEQMLREYEVSIDWIRGDSKAQLDDPTESWCEEIQLARAAIAKATEREFK